MTGVGPIVKGKPIPSKPREGRPVGAIGKIIREMAIGDARVFDSEKLLENARRAAQAAGFRILTRKDRDGWWIWRVE